MKQDYENPWKVTVIEDFQFFCCPECDIRKHSKEEFLTHAFETHPDAKEALNDILGIQTVIEVKAEEIDEVEEGFMRGYEEGSNEVYCQTCNKTLVDENIIEEQIEGRTLHFCSTECASKYETKKE